MSRWRDRSTGELLVLMVATTVCSYILLSIVVTLLLAFFTDRDVTTVARNISDIINTLIGLLAGYLAGRTDVNLSKSKNEKNPTDEP